MSAFVVAIATPGHELELRPPVDLDAETIREVRLADGTPLERRGDVWVWRIPDARARELEVVWITHEGTERRTAVRLIGTARMPEPPREMVVVLDGGRREAVIDPAWVTDSDVRLIAVAPPRHGTLEALDERRLLYRRTAAAEEGPDGFAWTAGAEGRLPVTGRVLVRLEVTDAPVAAKESRAGGQVDAPPADIPVTTGPVEEDVTGDASAVTEPDSEDTAIDTSATTDAGAGAASTDEPELPAALREVTVRNVAELRAALAEAHPGDHILLEDGVYAGPIEIGALRGTPDAPVVIRARNLLGARIEYGLRFEHEDAADVVVHGLHLSGVCWIRGTRIHVRRCRITLDYDPEGGGSAAMYVHYGRACRFDRCHIRLESREDYERRTGRRWTPPARRRAFHGVEVRGFRREPARSTHDLVFDRCHFEGGFADGRSRQPDTYLLFVADRAAATLDRAWDGVTSVIVRRCRFEPAHDYGPALMFMASRGVMEDCHLVARAGRAHLELPRLGFDWRVRGCRFEGGVLTVRSGRHLFENVVFERARLAAGQHAWDTRVYETSSRWPAAHGCRFYNCRGEVEVGWGKGARVPATDNLFVNHRGPVTDSQATGTRHMADLDPAHPPREPVTLDPSAVGIAVPWDGDAPATAGDSRTDDGSPSGTDGPASPSAAGGDGTAGTAASGADDRASTDTPSAEEVPATDPGTELPPATGERVVRNGRELERALAEARPGEHIVLEDGDYRGYWKITRGGAPGRPLVIRARNLLGARVGLGVRGFEVAADDVLIWGIDFRDCLWMPLNGRRITFRRCRIWPLYKPDGAIGLVPQDCEDVRIDYCTLRLYTTAEVEAMGARRLPHGSFWVEGANYGCIWCYTRTEAFESGRYPRRMVVERCRFEGGPSGVPYGAPNCQFVEWGGNPKVTSRWDEARNRPLYDSRNTVRLCYGDVDRDLTIIDIKGAGCVLDRVHLRSRAGKGAVQIRSGSGHRIVGCRFENGVYMSVQGRGHYVDNVVGPVLIMAGNALWDLSDGNRLGDWGAAFEVEVYRVRGVRIGHWWSGMGDPKHPARKITYGACPGAVIEHAEEVHEVDPPPATVAPVTLDVRQVGHDAPWVGVESTGVSSPAADTPPTAPSAPSMPSAPEASSAGKSSSVPGPAPSSSPVVDMSTDELPTPRREIRVSNTSALADALTNARPGDHIVLEDGVYGGPVYIRSPLRGTPEAPIVVRARNLLKARIENGIRIDAEGCRHVHFWGLDVYGVSWVRGDHLRVRRCRFESDYVPLKSTATLYVSEPSDGIHVDYCHFHQWTVEDHRRHTGRDFTPPDGYTHYTALKITGYKSDPARSPRNIVVHRCQFDGGFAGGQYYRPSHMLFLASDTGKATFDPRWRGVTSVTVRLCRFDAWRTAGPCLYTKASNTVFDRVHVVARNGKTYISAPRHGFDLRVMRCRFEGGRVSIKSGQHVYENTLFAHAALYSGTHDWNVRVPAGQSYWNATYRCRFYNCIGDVNVGTRRDWPFPSRECEFHNHRGAVHRVHEQGTVVDPAADPDHPVAEPIVVDPSEVGPYAPWRGEDG